MPANNVREFIDYLKANPDKVAYASAGQGSTNHLSAALFEKAAGVKMVHVPYRGGAPAVLDTVAGRTRSCSAPARKRCRTCRAASLLLAVTEEQRSPLLPGTPTVAETLPGYELSVWYGAFGPAGLPADLTTRLNKEINLILKRPGRRQEDGGHGRAAAGHHARAVRQDADARCRQIRQADQELGVTAE